MKVFYRERFTSLAEQTYQFQRFLSEIALKHVQLFDSSRAITDIVSCLADNPVRT